jgi:toxin ParE1/3/4
MKKALIIRPDAERDLTEAFGWYEAQVPGSGSNFLLSIDAARHPSNEPLKCIP